MAQPSASLCRNIFYLGSFATGAGPPLGLLDIVWRVRDNRRKTFMICPIWRELQSQFVLAAKAIEENDERLPGGTEGNRQLNAAARAAAQELLRHEQEHACKPNREEILAESLRRRKEALHRVRARQRGSDS